MATTQRATTQKKTFKIEVSLNDQRCGSCSFLNTRFPKAKETCAEQGYQPTSRVCDFYTPNYRVLSQQETVNHTLLLIEALRHAPANLLSVMAYLMASSSRVNRSIKESSGGRLSFLQKVYYKYRGIGDYVSNWCSGYILDSNSGKITLLAKSGEFVVTVEGSESIRGLKTEEEFQFIKDDMVAAGAVFDPEISSYAERVLKIHMKTTATRKKPEGEIDLDAARESGELLETSVLESAGPESDLSKLFSELSAHGTVAETVHMAMRKGRFKEEPATHPATPMQTMRMSFDEETSEE